MWVCVVLYFAVECWDRVEILSKELLNDMKIFAFCILLIWSKLFESLLTHFSEIILKQRAILGMAKMAHTYGPMASSNGGHSQGWSGYIGCPCLNFMLILKNLHVNYQKRIYLNDKQEIQSDLFHLPIWTGSKIPTQTSNKQLKLCFSSRRRKLCWKLQSSTDSHYKRCYSLDLEIKCGGLGRWILYSF